MRRRNFVSKSLVGLIGYGVTQNTLADLIKPSSEVMQWFYQYLKLTSLTAFQIFDTADQQLSSSIHGVIRSLEAWHDEKIYKPVFYHEGKYCLVPFELKIGSSYHEIRIASFCKQDDGTWRLVTQINGFELEAIVRAGNELRENYTDLADLLLPILPEQKQFAFPQKFFTTVGRIGFRIDLGGKKAISSITIFRSTELICAHQFESMHCLTGSMMIA